MATNPKPAEKPDSDDLAAEVAALKKDIADLASSLGRAGKAKAAEGRAAGEAALEDIEREWHDLESRLGERVRRKPLQSLGIAALIGFFIAILMRR